MMQGSDLAWASIDRSRETFELIETAIETCNELATALAMNPIFEKHDTEVYTVITPILAQERVPQEDKLKESKKKGAIREIGGLIFVKIPEGSFMMGSPDGEGENKEHPLHR